MRFFFFSFSFLSLLIIFPNVISQSKSVTALPLHTESRWIVDENGKRVKLACVNWVSHLDPIVAEGLSKQPVDAISKKITSMGFNCVRLTWPTVLATDNSVASLTVRKSFQNLKLSEALAGIQTYNPSIIDLSLTDAFKAVVSSLGKNNVMVILDNHVSKPGWCCDRTDGNGFFGDQYFDSNVWIKGLTQMATMFNGVSNVIGMSLRNELRGPRQNEDDWYKYMQQGAEAVHSANPNVLVILSGLSFDKDLSFLRNKQVSLSFTKKLVFEMHWYRFTDGYVWDNGNANQVCANVRGNYKRWSLFLVEQGWPLFVSEFGMDLKGNNMNDNRYMNCIISVLAELDLDWALWTLAGDYYLRNGVTGLIETYGVLTENWRDIRSSTFLQRISALQSPLQGPGLPHTNPQKIIFHPLTGLCVVRKTEKEPLSLGPCSEAAKWKYSTTKQLLLNGTMLCLKTDKLGKPVKLDKQCTSNWETTSDSKLHLSARSTATDTSVCLNVDDTSNTIITDDCNCLSEDSTCHPMSQWFQLIKSYK